MDTTLEPLKRIVERGGRIVVLSGAGMSAESGIPTFRGPEGFWTVGSRVYRPEELATWSTFSRHPELVWPWYLWRRQTCREANPNDAHRALVEIEAHLGDQFTLVTQNVDGLHLRAGSSTDQTYEIHGNIDYFRCINGCGPRRSTPDLPHVDEQATFHPEWAEALSCSNCRTWMRPHVLWFDESYNENHYRFDSTMRAMNQADAMIVVGTTGTTSLPAHMLQIATMRDIPLYDINPNDNPFARAAMNGRGGWIQSTATSGVAAVRDAIVRP